MATYEARHYSLAIQWDTHDQIYIVDVPELPGCMTHGKTYEEAINNALEAIEVWIEGAQEVDEAVPPPRVRVAV